MTGQAEESVKGVNAMRNKINLILADPLVFLILLFLVGIFTAYPVSSGEFHAKYSSYTKKVVSPVMNILIDDGVCKDVNSCRKEGVIFFGPEKDYLKIEIYQISDLNTLNKIISTILTIYEDGMYDFSILVESHKTHHRTNLEFFSRWFINDINLILKLQGK